MPRVPHPPPQAGRPAAGNSRLPPIPELESTPGHLIRRAQQVHTAIWTAELGGHLTGPQYALVSALKSSVDLDQRSAGLTASLDKSTTADVIARLERNGWLRRSQDPRDGRRKLLLLTPAASAALNDLTPRVQGVQRRLLLSLPPTEREPFVRALGLVAYAGDPPRSVDADPQVVTLSTAPGHLLRRSEQVHGALWNTYVGSLVTPSQYALLCAVAAREGLDQSTAGDLASLDKSSVAEVVRRLCQREWLIAMPDPDDRRRKCLRLTPAARSLFEKATPGVMTVQAELLSPLRERDRDTFITQLRQIGQAGSGH